MRCVATEIVQEPGSCPRLLGVQDCREQHALTISDDKLRALLADQPLFFALIFWIAEVPPFALLRRGSKVKDVTFRTWREVTLCKWLRLLSTPQDFLNLVLPVHS